MLGFKHMGKIMSKYFVIAEDGVGPGGDIYFRKDAGNDRWYSLYLDKVKIGLIMDSSFRGGRSWTGLSLAKDSKWFNVRMIEGFATRMAAATFVINHHGYWMQKEEDSLESIRRGEKFLFNLNMKKAHEIIEGVEI
jgi:hypothetical protein